VLGAGVAGGDRLLVAPRQDPVPEHPDIGRSTGRAAAIDDEAAAQDQVERGHRRR
jgi:hypothetical protein